MQEFYTLASAVSTKTFQQRLLHAGMPQEPDFPSELERLAAMGRVRGFILLLKHNAIAYSLWYVHDNTLTLDKTGFDPEYAELNPGTVLMYLSLQALFAEHRFQILDFGSGYYDYKALFATDRMRCADLIYLRRTPINLTLVLAHAGLNTLSELLKRGLDAVGLKLKIKKLMRKI